MQFISTRNQCSSFCLSDAIQTGLSPDGGLFIPESFPTIHRDTLYDVNDFIMFAYRILQPFFQGDRLEPHLMQICQSTFTFPVPLISLSEESHVLELFHGPTASFKDFGARFLANCMQRMTKTPKTILVATSGDTGSAVGCAFYRRPHYKVVILYPDGKISKRQEQQMTCWDSNIFSFAVKGSFDDCQRMVKAAFAKSAYQSKLSSANSINIGRLLPQMTYFAYQAVQYYKQYQREPTFIIPSGNLGHATAAYWARTIGMPIGKIILSTNANRVLPDYLETRVYRPRESIITIANAMDVGQPSNFERLQALYPSFDELSQNITAIAVDDAKIKNTIAEVYKRHQYICCPHTATAFYAQQYLCEKNSILVATASPAKFETCIEPILNCSIPVTNALKCLLERPMLKRQMDASLDQLGRWL